MELYRVIWRTENRASKTSTVSHNEIRFLLSGTPFPIRIAKKAIKTVFRTKSSHMRKSRFHNTANINPSTVVG